MIQNIQRKHETFDTLGIYLARILHILRLRGIKQRGTDRLDLKISNSRITLLATRNYIGG